MLELEIQKLTAAIEKLTSVFEAAEAARYQVAADLAVCGLAAFSHTRNILRCYAACQR